MHRYTDLPIIKSTGLVLKYTSTRVRLDTASTDTTCYSCIRFVSMPACTQLYLGYNCIRAYPVPTYLDPRSPRHGSVTWVRNSCILINNFKINSMHVLGSLQQGARSNSIDRRLRSRYIELRYVWSPKIRHMRLRKDKCIF